METATLMDVLRISEQLSPADQLRLIGLLSDRLRGEMAAHTEPIDMLSLTGVGAELWQEFDDFVPWNDAALTRREHYRRGCAPE